MRPGAAGGYNEGAMKEHGKRVVVVGAGVGGMAAAARLAKDGFRVTVVERNDQVGGRARIWEKDGYVFDMGPSWYLMPEVFERFFTQLGKKTADYYELKQLARERGYRLLTKPVKPASLRAFLAAHHQVLTA